MIKNVTVDTATGEIVKVAKTKDQFVLLFLDHLKLVYGVERASPEVFFEILKLMTGENKVQLNLPQKENIAKATKLSLSYVNITMTQLVKGGVMKKIGRCTYMVNPILVGKTNWNKIKSLRIQFQAIDESGQSFKKEIANEN